VVEGECTGIGCCEASLPNGIANINVTVSSFLNHTTVDFNPCSVAYAVAKDAFKFKKSNLTQNTGFYEKNPLYPVVFNWGIGTKNCSLAKAKGNCLCKNNTICSDLKPDQDGYRCDCKPGFTGNPYLPQGCRDINECNQANDCEKPEYCTNTKGSYLCKCPKGYHGNGTKTDGCISSKNAWLTPVIITAEDLEDATQNYDDMNIIGRGGFGVVYRGLLPNNQHVAIKRSLKVDPNQVEQFINEVLVLSQINNRNVVKLIGCCLETEVPLLVYEFINNGTLYDHLSDDSKAHHLTWQMRLRIASEIAEVLAYLHTTISTPIIHRDMKTMNILLDEYYTAKVADFGASRLCPVDQDQLATMVLGTIGYLDPEYMQTSELTEKSDVYSFGVVLVELLTRKKAISYQRPEVERCLAMHFILKMKEDRLFDIVDRNIGNNELEMEQIKDMAELGRWCLRLKGEERPTMKEAAMELDRIKRKGSHPWDNNVKLTHQDEREYLLQIVEDDDGNTGCNDSDLYNPPSFVSPLGGGDESGSPSSLVIAPHCTSKCGNLTIPYPFGIEDGCYFIDKDNPNFYHPIMKLTCNDTHYDPPQLILGSNLEILGISLQDPEIRIMNYISFSCYDGGESTISFKTWLRLGVFTLSSTKNNLIATGCDTYAWFYGVRHGEPYSTGCMTECTKLQNVVDGDCNGVGCCEASLPNAVTNITVIAKSFYNHTNVDFNPCSAAYPVAKDAFVFKRSNLTQTSGFYSKYPMLPVVFNWGIGTKNCSLAKAKGNCLCKNNTICSDLKTDQDGYRCDCETGFTGNPYLPRGCTGKTMSRIRSDIALLASIHIVKTLE
ncbi:hypothetical protein KSS87_010610, partial [Heliosperma pusillum]